MTDKDKNNDGKKHKDVRDRLAAAADRMNEQSSQRAGGIKK